MPRGDPKTVREVMATDVRCVAPSDELDTAARLLESHHVRQALVLGDDGRLLGAVSYRDLLRVLASRSRQEIEAGIPVSEVMTTDLESVRSDAPLLDVVRRMLHTRATAFPVVDDGRVVGIISEHDLVPVTRDLLERMLTDV